MGAKKQVTAGSRKSLNVFITFIVAIIGILVLLQSLSFSEGGTAAIIYAQDPSQVISSTLTTEEQIDAYIAAHLIQGDVMPPTMPEEQVNEEPHPAVMTPLSSSIALVDDMILLGQPGEVITYTLKLSNSGTLSDVYEIMAVSSWPITITNDVYTVSAGAAVDLILTVKVPSEVEVGDSDSAVVTATSLINPLNSDSASLTTATDLYTSIFPLVFKPIPAPVLSATRPNSANDWQMNWTISDDSAVIEYELQQSQDATFSTGVTSYNLSPSNSSKIINTIQPSANNVYYYRIRVIGTNMNSDWSTVVQVIGAYYDEFTSNQTGWSGPTLKDSLRRLTYIEKIDSWYEVGEWLIVRVEDSYDWTVVSPLMPAPQPPYVIEFRSKPAHTANLVSHGVVFGGDWHGAPCPDWRTVLGVYAHENCFNHFYNTNLIWSSDSDMTLLWERIDTLVWCPDCGGSPLKRLGDNNVAGTFHPNASDWINYRIEVRNDNIKFYLNGSQKHTYNDTRWIHEPYFGVFASTNEYSNSTWRWEYFKITPLDS